MQAKEPKVRFGNKIIHKSRKVGLKLRTLPRFPDLFVFLKDLIIHTPFLQMFALLIVIWLVFSTIIFFVEHHATGTPIHTFSDALYTLVAAFSTSGISQAPVTSTGKFFCALMMVFGSAIFFGSIVAAMTTYFMRPLYRPKKQLISMIKYNLEQIDGLTIEELELLRETANSLIDEQIKQNKLAANHSEYTH